MPNVTVTDATGATGFAQFAIPADSSVYTNVGNNGFWPPFGTDTLFFSTPSCDLDYSLPVDSFSIVNALTLGTDTFIVSWVVYQLGEPFNILGFYPQGGFDPTVLSLVLWCENGRSEVGIIQLYELFDFSTLTSIAEESAEQFIQVFPNPNNGQFSIQLNNTEPVHLEIFDVSGKSVLSQTMRGSTLYPIDLNVAEGVYILRMENEHGIGFRRLVKQ